MNITLKYLLADQDSYEFIKNALHNTEKSPLNLRCITQKDLHSKQVKHMRVLDDTSLISDCEKAVLAGMVLGLLGGIYVLAFPLWITISPAWYSDAPWYVILGTLSVAGGVVMGVGMAILRFQLSLRNKKRYLAQISQGKVLLLVTVPLHRACRIHSLIKAFIKRATP